MDKVFSAEVISKAAKWILGKDSTAVATWITAAAIMGSGYLFYERVYLPGRQQEREERLKLAQEYAKGAQATQAMAEAAAKACDNDKERLFKANEALMNRVDRMLEQQRFGYSSAADAGVVASPVPSEFDCDP